MRTEELIARLAAEPAGVRPLPSPWRRAGAWTAVGLAYFVALTLVMPVRPDLAARFGDARFMVEQLMALLTGVTAAVAAFASVVPGYSRAVLAAPVVSLGIWLAAVTLGMAQDAARAVPLGAALRPHWACIGAIALGAVVPAAALSVMIRRGAPVTPRLTAALAALAAAGLANGGMCVVHADGASSMILLWHGGTIVVAAAAAGAAGARLLRWPVTPPRIA
jgi:hypothetical protein